MKRREFGHLMLGSVIAAGLPPLSAKRAQSVQVDGARINQQLAVLSQFGRNPQGGVTRLAYSEEDRNARASVLEWMRAARLETSVDHAGNIFGRRAGSNSGMAPLIFGSHVDSVPEGGNFDGNVGTLAAIEAARVIAERGITMRHPIEVVVWANEEGGLYGSRAVSGQLRAEELSNVSRSGKSISDGITFLGGSPARLDEVVRAKGSAAAYLELHIEQGGTLERERIDIGIVEGIVGIRQWEVTVTGFANHAGTTPMDQRQDAMLSAARFVDMVNRIVRSVQGRQVGTVGRMQAFPGAPNVVPGQVICTLELRDLDAGKTDMLAEQIFAEARRIGEATGTTFAYKELHTSVPAPSDARMRNIISDVAGASRLSVRGMPSGAGHDAQAIAQLAPMGMIFIPSIGGISHSPKEFSREQDIVNGANVLLGAVLAADRSLS